MEYYTKLHTEHESMQITKEEARHFLEYAYIKKAVDDVIDNGKAFRLWTPFRDVWTKTEDGLVPIPGFYGICE